MGTRMASVEWYLRHLTPHLCTDMLTGRGYKITRACRRY